MSDDFRDPTYSFVVFFQQSRISGSSVNPVFRHCQPLSLFSSFIFSQHRYACVGKHDGIPRTGRGLGDTLLMPWFCSGFELYGCGRCLYVASMGL